MRTATTGLMALVAALCFASSVPAQEETAGTTEATPNDDTAVRTAPPERGPVTDIRISEIKRPQDFAPPERKLVGRDPADFRKDGTLLATTTTIIPRVKEAELRERVIAMCEGRRFDMPMTPVETPEALAALSGVVQPPVPAGDDASGGWSWWALIPFGIAGAGVSYWGWERAVKWRRRRMRTSASASASSRSRAEAGLQTGGDPSSPDALALQFVRAKKAAQEAGAPHPPPSDDNRV